MLWIAFFVLIRALPTPQIILAVDDIWGCHIQLGIHDENCHFKFFKLECWDMEFSRLQSEDSLPHKPSYHICPSNFDNYSIYGSAYPPYCYFSC